MAPPTPPIDVPRAANLAALGCEKLTTEAQRERCYDAEIKAGESRLAAAESKSTAIKVGIAAGVTLPLLGLTFFLVWKLTGKSKKLPKK